MDHYIRFRNNRYNYEIEAAQCPPVPEVPLQEVASEANTILKAAGAQACKTDASIQQAEFQAKANAGFVSTAIGGKVSNSNTSAIGCEQLAVAANKYNKTVQNVACLLKTSKNVARTTVSGINNIMFESTNGSVSIDCPDGLEFAQKMSLNIISKLNLSSQEVTNIASEVNDTVKTVVDAVQSSESGIGATPQGQKSISDTLTNINIVDQKNRIDEQIKELNTSLSGVNTVMVRAKGDVNVKGKQCKISQDMIIDMVADQLVSDAVTNSLSSLSTAVMETETKLAQEAKNKGAEALALDLEVGKVNPWIILGIVGIIGVIVLIVIFTKVKGSFNLGKVSDTLTTKMSEVGSNKI